MEGLVEGEHHLHIRVTDEESNVLVYFGPICLCLSRHQLTISSCSCLCRVELSFSCCLLYICMISTTILSLSSSCPPTTTAEPFVAEPVSLAGTSAICDNNDVGGGGGVWVAFLQLGLLVSMETAWVWHSCSAAEAAAACWDLASSAPAVMGGDA